MAELCPTIRHMDDQCPRIKSKGRPVSITIKSILSIDLSLISEPDAAGSCFGSQDWALIFSSSSFPTGSRSPFSDQYERACMTLIAACVALLTHALGCVDESLEMQPYESPA